MSFIAQIKPSIKMAQSELTKIKQLEGQVLKQDQMLSEQKKKMSKQEEALTKWLE